MCLFAHSQMILIQRLRLWTCLFIHVIHLCYTQVCRKVLPLSCATAIVGRNHMKRLCWWMAFKSSSFVLLWSLEQYAQFFFDSKVCLINFDPMHRVFMKKNVQTLSLPCVYAILISSGSIGNLYCLFLLSFLSALSMTFWQRNLFVAQRTPTSSNHQSILLFEPLSLM